MSVESFGRALKSDLHLEWKRECARELAADALPLDAQGKPGYMVDTVETFRATARRAAGLEVQGSGLGVYNPEPANEPAERASQGFQGLQGGEAEVAEDGSLVLPFRPAAGGGS
jgi:hypothetical protein